MAAAKGPAFADHHELRRRDLYGYAMAVDSRAVVPRLRDEGLVDVAGGTPGVSPGIHAAD